MRAIPITAWLWTTLLLLSLAALPLRAASGPPQDAPRVAVFYEPGFPYYGVDPATDPREVARQLQAAGLQAQLLGEEALSDPARFHSRAFDALVLPYGNTFPQKAFDAMQSFHRAGGAFILTGIPFTHPVVRTAGGGWTDLGHHSEPALFGPEGLGVGGFAGPGMSAPPQVAPGDPLHLTSLHLDWASEIRAQWLDPASLPAGATLIPAVGTTGQPLAALVLHRSPPFAGAVDVWAHRGPEGDLGAWGTVQVLLRGTVVALERKGLLAAGSARAALARFGRLPRPPVYAGLTLPAPRRPYATFHPKMPPPARHLLVADVRRLTREERILLLSLQGLVNRRQPRIYLISGDEDRFWLEEMRRQGQTDAPIPVVDPLSLVKTYRGVYRGAVVPDPKVYLSACAAACLAGADDLLLATPALAKRLGLPIKADLRGRFRDSAAALRFVRTAVMPRLNPYLACCLDPAIFDTGALDHIIAAKGLVFWITGAKAQGLPGANGAGEMAEVKAMLAKMPLEAVVRGFWWHGEDIGINEGPGVSLASRFGKVTVVSDYVANFSVFSGVPIMRLKQARRPAPPLDRSKVYFAFTMSDGDNLCTWRAYFRTYFEDPLHGTIPIGWGMGPTLVDCAPTWARWYYARATPNDEFLCDVSGVGYIYGPDWATALKDRAGAFADFYRWTARYMQRMDMRTIRLMNVGPADIEQAARLMPEVDFLMPDYGNTGTHTYGGLTYTLPTGQAVFRAATDSISGPERLAAQIRERVGRARPAFLNVFIWNWGSKLADLKRVIELLGPDYVAVTPSQLHTLYRQSRDTP